MLMSPQRCNTASAAWSRATRATFAWLGVAAACCAVGCSDETKTAPAPRTTGTASGASTSTIPATAAVASLHVTRMAKTDTVVIAGEAGDVTERSTYTAYAVDGHIARIDEVSAPGSETKFVRAYVLDARERLAHMTEDKSQMVSNTNASPSEQHVNSVVDLDSSIVRKSTKRVDGVEKPMQPWDLDNVRRHAALLVTLARPGIAKPVAPEP
jgi:endonuclease YncB( thermonuclease family)